jgi:hypothetical protein
MPNILYNKIKRHLQLNQTNESVRDGQEQLMRDLPQSLASQIIEITHGQIIDKINFLKDKQ